ncbi:MAG TPA: VTT domain-containing protein [Patescibacteria group bacterium]|nr:VTT domain-containing protein [Patescibacteria group bacterium]
MLSQLKHLLDVHFLVQTFGLPGITLIIFAETGLMLGFFLPGDSLLITGGIFAAKGDMSLPALFFFVFLAASLGNIAGYFFGHKVGRRLFHRSDSFLFKKEYVESAQEFYKKHGGKAVILARFMPIIRTFAPIVAGIAQMDLTTFVIYSVIGSLLWAVGLTLIGFYLGQLIPDKYFEPIILGVIFVSLLPAIIHALKSKSTRQKLLGIIKR